MRLDVFDQAGTLHRLERGGSSVMELIRDSGVSIAAQCGASCGTCHVYVDLGYVDLIPAPAPGEIDMRDLSEAVRLESRLSCQIALREEPDGMVVPLAPGTGC